MTHNSTHLPNEIYFLIIFDTFVENMNKHLKMLKNINKFKKIKNVRKSNKTRTFIIINIHT